MILQKKKEINYIFMKLPLIEFLVDYGNGEMLSWISSMREIEKNEKLCWKLTIAKVFQSKKKLFFVNVFTNID